MFGWLMFVVLIICTFILDVWSCLLCVLVFVLFVVVVL